MAGLVVRNHLSLACAARILEIAPCDFCALYLANHGMREAVRANTEHPVSSISHGDSAVAAILLPQTRLIIFVFPAIQNIARNL